MFDDVNNAQWMWYYYNMLEDQNEKFETQRDFIEYHASFIEPEAVRKIRESRDNTVTVPHDDFVAGIERAFGRKITIDREKKKGTETHEVKAAGIGARTLAKLESESKPPKPNFRNWTELDLEKDK